MKNHVVSVLSKGLNYHHIYCHGFKNYDEMVAIRGSALTVQILTSKLSNREKKKIQDWIVSKCFILFFI